MRLRVTEISQHPVTEILGNKAAGAGDYLGATAVIGADDLAQLLGIEPRRQCRGSDEVSEHDRELAAFGFGSLATEAVGYDRVISRANWLGSQPGDRIEENTAMSNRRHTEVFEVLGGQLGQDCPIDRVVPECLLVAFQAEAAQPGTDIHGIHTHTWTHSSTGYSRHGASLRQRSGRPTRMRETQFTPPHGENHVFCLVKCWYPRINAGRACEAPLTERCSRGASRSPTEQSGETSTSLLARLRHAD
jgi:hypothetical protein